MENLTGAIPSTCWGVLHGDGLPTVYLLATQKYYIIGREHTCSEENECQPEHDCDVKIQWRRRRHAEKEEHRPEAHISHHHLVIEWDGTDVAEIDQGPSIPVSRNDEDTPFTVHCLGQNGIQVQGHTLWATENKALFYGDSIRLISKKVLRRDGLPLNYLCYTLWSLQAFTSANLELHEDDASETSGALGLKGLSLAHN